MPCSKYEGSQRRLCYATEEWTDWTKINFISNKLKNNPKVIKLKESKKWNIKKDKNGKSYY